MPNKQKTYTANGVTVQFSAGYKDVHAYHRTCINNLEMVKKNPKLSHLVGQYEQAIKNLQTARA